LIRFSILLIAMLTADTRYRRPDRPAKVCVARQIADTNKIQDLVRRYRAPDPIDFTSQSLCSSPEFHPGDFRIATFASHESIESIDFNDSSSAGMVYKDGGESLVEANENIGRDGRMPMQDNPVQISFAHTKL
jgi:hypothetical protein